MEGVSKRHPLLVQAHTGDPGMQKYEIYNTTNKSTSGITARPHHVPCN